MKNLLAFAKQKLSKLFSKETYYDFWYDDVLGIGSTSIEDVQRIDETKKTKKRTAIKKA